MIVTPFLISVVGLPRSILYFLDVLNLALFLYSLKRLFSRNEHAVRVVLIYLTVFFLFTLIGFLVNQQSILYYLWGLRNTFRFFLFFCSCLCWIRLDQLPSLLQLLEWFLYLNVPVCCLQLWVQRIPFDNIGGLFGIGDNCNSYMNILLIIVTAWSILRFLYKQIPLWRFALVIAAGMSISILSELKAYYFELAMIVVLALVFQIIKKEWNRRIFKTIGICAAGMLLLAVFTVVLQPKYWSGFFLPGGVWEEITRSSGYSGSGDLNRLTAVPYIFVNFFGSGLSSLLGFGIGNCDYSSFAFLTTPFYEAYQNLHYVWIHIAFLFLELGFIGTALYTGIFVVIGIAAWKNQKRELRGSDVSILNQMTVILSVSCLFLLFYDVTLRMESAYIIFALLAVPYMKTAKHTEVQL